MVKQSKTKKLQNQIYDQHEAKKNPQTNSSENNIFLQLKEKHKKKYQKNYKTIHDFFCLKKPNSNLQVSQNYQKSCVTNQNSIGLKTVQNQQNQETSLERKNRDFQILQKKQLYQRTKFSQHTISTLCQEEENQIIKKDLQWQRQTTLKDSIENSFCNIEGLFENQNQSEKIQSVKNNFNNIKNDFFSKLNCKRKKIRKPSFFLNNLYQTRIGKLDQKAAQLIYNDQQCIQNYEFSIEQQSDSFVDPTLNYSFILEKKIGDGAFSVVYQVKSKCSGKPYAIKTLNNEKLKQSDSQQVIENEIKILQQISHKNIVSLESVIRSKNFTHLVLKLVKGRNIEDILKDKKILSQKESKNILKQLIDALMYLHEKRIFHRDLKLANLLLEEEDNKLDKLYLIDFGFSMMVPQNFQIKGFCGTPNYMSPELKQEKLYCPEKAEIWALAGSFPKIQTQNGTVQVQIEKKLNQKVQNLLRGMLQVDPQQRLTLNQIALSEWMSKQILQLIYIIEKFIILYNFN